MITSLSTTFYSDGFGPLTLITLFWNRISSHLIKSLAEVILLCETELKSKSYDLKSTNVIYYSVKLCENIASEKPNPFIFHYFCIVESIRCHKSNIG